MSAPKLVYPPVIVHAGDKITCPHCKQKHVLISSTNEQGQVDEFILAYKCEDSIYVAAISNRLLELKEEGK